MENARDRNDAIERLLQEVRPALDPRPAGPCLTPEELAAWVDGGLSQHEAARAETHAASCAECRQLMAAFARALPDARHAASRPSVRWLVPMAAAAVVVLGVWLNRPGIPGAPTTSAPAPQSARLGEGPSAEVRAPAPPPLPPERPAPRPPAAARTEPARQGTPRADARSKAVSPASPAAQGVAQSREASVTPAPTPAENDRAAADAREVPAPAAPLARSRVAAALAKRSETPAPAIASPSGRSRWRVAAPGVLEQSGDGGLTWTAAINVPPGVAPSIVAGASPADDICWLVGRGGLVLLTRDGRRFNRITPPEMVDLVAVQAEDSDTAVVRGANGRSWRTRDGGRTWAGQP